MTDTTDIPESEWGVVVWLNPNHTGRPQSRLLEAIVSDSSGDPIAFPIRSLQLTMRDAILPTSADIEGRIMSSTKENPLIIPVPMAREWLGWDDFCLISTDTESK